MRPRYHSRHAPGGGLSRRQCEWDRADSHKQNQIKCASNKMRFDGGINLFFHVGSLVKRSSSHFGCGLPILYQKLSRNVNTKFCKFLVAPRGAPRRGCGGTSLRGSGQIADGTETVVFRSRSSGDTLRQCADRGGFPRAGNSEFYLASSQTNEQTTGLMAAAAVSDEALASVKAAVVRSQ